MPILFSGPGSKSFVRTIRSFLFSDDELCSANFTKHKTSHFTLVLNLSEAEFEDRNVSEGGVAAWWVTVGQRNRQAPIRRF